MKQRKSTAQRLRRPTMHKWVIRTQAGDLVLCWSQEPVRFQNEDQAADYAETLGLHDYRIEVDR
jgi:hypothetical protein